MEFLPRYNGPGVLPGGTVDLLILLPFPTGPDLKSGSLFTSPENNFLLNFLAPEALPPGITWAVDTVFHEYIKKPLKADYKAVEGRVADVVTNSGCRVVLAMGSPALQCLWDTRNGKCPSVHKARSLPVELSPGRTLVSTYAPKKHHDWVRTDGRISQDCTDEWIRAFSMVVDLLQGTYQAPELFRFDVNTEEAFAELVHRMDRLCIDDIDLDIEDDTYIGKGLQPHKWDEEYPSHPMPEKLSMWHADNRLLEVGITIGYKDPVSGNTIEETYTLHPRVCTAFNLERLLRGCLISAWNASYEFAGLFRYCGVKLEDWILADEHLGDGVGTELEDCMILKGAVDHSLPGLGLKATASEEENIPTWDLEILRELEAARARNKKEGGPGVASFGDCDAQVRHEYNGWDTLALRRLRVNYFYSSRFPGLAPGCLTYDFLVKRALPTFGCMEREGVCVDLDHLYAMLDKYEAASGQALDAVLTNRYVQDAVVWSEKEYNPRSPIFFEMLVAMTHGKVGVKTVTKRPGKSDKVEWGHQFPEWIPRTKTGKLSRGAAVMALLAGNDEETYLPVVPVAEKTEEQLVWHLILSHKRALDYWDKYCTILNHTSGLDHRIHPSVRLIRAEVPKEDQLDASEHSGGAVSGRTSMTPNMQNAMHDPDIERCFVAPREQHWYWFTDPCPGKRWVILELDVSRSELVWLGYNTNDPLLRQWALEGSDQHAEKGRSLWSVSTGRPATEYDLLSDEEKDSWRSKGKTQNFADVYLQEPETIAAMWELPLDEVLETMHLSMLAHPGMTAAKYELYDILQAGGYIQTSVLGRVRSAPGWRPSTQTAEEFLSLDPAHRKNRNSENMKLFRSLWNTKGAQADSNDYVMYKAAQIWLKLRGRQWLNPDWVRHHNFIHDSLKYYVPEDYVMVAAQELAREMMDHTTVPCNGVIGGFDLKLRVDAAYGYTANKKELVEIELKEA